MATVDIQQLLEEKDLYINSPIVKKEDKQLLAPSGVTLIDLVTYGIHFSSTLTVTGDSSSGKTFFLMELGAAAKRMYGKDKVKVKYIDSEGRLSFDTEEMYGYKLNEGITKFPTKLEEVIADLDYEVNSLEEDQKLIYIIDSLDAMQTDDDIEDKEAKIKAYKKGESSDRGSYGDKAKKSKQIFRQAIPYITNKPVLFVAVQQLSYNLNSPYNSKNYVSSGTTWLYNATVKIEFKRIGEDPSKLPVYFTTRAIAKKNTSPRPDRYANILVSYEYGFDDIGTNLCMLGNGMTDKGALSTRFKLKWGDKEFTDLNEAALYIQDNGLEEELRKAVIIKWEQDEEEARKSFVRRKRKLLE